MFISVAAGVLLALLIIGVLAAMWSCFRSCEMKMLRTIRSLRNQISDLREKLDCQEEFLFEVSEFMSNMRAERNQSHRSATARPRDSVTLAESFPTAPFNTAVLSNRKKWSDEALKYLNKE